MFTKNKVEHCTMSFHSDTGFLHLSIWALSFPLLLARSSSYDKNQKFSSHDLWNFVPSIFGKPSSPPLVFCLLITIWIASKVSLCFLKITKDQKKSSKEFQKQLQDYIHLHHEDCTWYSKMFSGNICETDWQTRKASDNFEIRKLLALLNFTHAY